MPRETLSRRFPSVNPPVGATEIVPFITESGSPFKSSLHAARRSHTPMSVNRAPSAQKHAQLSPLIWWRTRKPRLRLCQGIREIREALLGTEIRGQPDWSRAILGDAAIAIGVAGEQMKAHVITATEVDLALSAVLACALEGDPASPIVISSALRRRAKDDPSCKPLSDLWLVAKF
jgi:hypothetical protein